MSDHPAEAPDLASLDLERYERGAQILRDHEYEDTELGMICLVCQRDPENLTTGQHEPDCWLDEALQELPV